MQSMTSVLNEMNLSDLTFELKRCFRRSAKDVVYIGYILRRVLDLRLWQESYDDFDSYLHSELHLEYSVACRFIQINKKFSCSGNSAELSEKYSDFSQGLLIEMLSMTPEQEAKVTPDMTVKQAREIKKKDKKTIPVQSQKLPEKVETIIDGNFREIKDSEQFATSQSDINLSPYGYPKSEYPSDSLIATEGCGHKYYCFTCAQDCSIRQKDRYCVEAPLGHPFSCITMNVLDNLKNDFSEQCQFVNQNLADVRSGDGSFVPCCKNCHVSDCGYRCRRSVNGVTRKSDVQTEKKLDKIATSQLENVNQEYVLQSVLPLLKNNDQRKEWLSRYKDWGLWYHDDHIDVNYYKFDFEDGSRLVAAEFPHRRNHWNNDYSDQVYFHLLEKNYKGYKSTYDKQYVHAPDSETYIIDFLKDLQKKK